MYLCLEPPKKQAAHGIKYMYWRGYLRGTMGKDLVEPGKTGRLWFMSQPSEEGWEEGVIGWNILTLQCSPEGVWQTSGSPWARVTLKGALCLLGWVYVSILCNSLLWPGRGQGKHGRGMRPQVSDLTFRQVKIWETHFQGLWICSPYQIGEPGASFPEENLRRWWMRWAPPNTMCKAVTGHLSLHCSFWIVLTHRPTLADAGALRRHVA